MFSVPHAAASMLCFSVPTHYVLFGAKSTKNAGGFRFPPHPHKRPLRGAALSGFYFFYIKLGNIILYIALRPITPYPQSGVVVINAMRLCCTFSPRRTGMVPSRLPARNFRIASTKNAGASKLSIHAIFGHVPKIAYRAASGVPQQRGATHAPAGHTSEGRCRGSPRGGRLDSRRLEIVPPREKGYPRTRRGIPLRGTQHTPPQTACLRAGRLSLRGGQLDSRRLEIKYL